ncbi:hypothetical protein BEWA_010880 [Theileria equi strain WA]|uniref:Uncharacterized protein n=1 Tax=Theileria equi strain WA TaxID=1537102 RepID=L0B368_THEEQ|nr:hypothetical protein BEWA_010880 [Theileria equi strain WA]AFZ81671.1 hypothetical protein BEWA_010880 [Theileria equi strain WA]|eukprot:XP_004831337.1 hypothetical protein BEWA_010880 [Theileria equi strain WA]
MKKDKILDDIQIVETFSNCDSFDNLDRLGCGVHLTIPSGEIETKEFVKEIECHECSHSSLTNNTQSISTCKDIYCKMKISNLEAMVRLLEMQNSQLIVNMCALYNTMVQHIENLEKANK